MANHLAGKTMAILATDGVERVDLERPRQAVTDAGATVESGKPIGTICHGPWRLAEAGVLRGRRITSFPMRAVVHDGPRGHRTSA